MPTNTLPAGDCIEVYGRNGQCKGYVIKWAGDWYAWEMIENPIGWRLEQLGKHCGTKEQALERLGEACSE